MKEIKINYFYAKRVVAVYTVVQLCDMLGSLSDNLGSLSFKLSDHIHDKVIHDHLFFHKPTEKFVMKKNVAIKLSKIFDKNCYV